MVQLKLTKSAERRPMLFLVGFGGLLALLSGPPAGAQGEATVFLQPTRLQVAVPEPVNEPFVIQIFEINVRETGEVWRHMRAASAIHEMAEENAVIEIIRPYGDVFYLHAKSLQDLTYVRVIRTSSLTYRDYKPTLFDHRQTGDLFVDGYVKDHEIFSSYVSDGFEPISRSESFTIHIVREQDPDYISDLDYSQNLGFVEGIPPGFSRSLPLDTPLGWHYQVDGIYFTESGAERYLFSMYVVDAAGEIRYPIGGRVISINLLRERSFRVDEVSYAGD